MPPRKKATAADPNAPAPAARPTRASTRAKAPVTAAPAPATATAPAVPDAPKPASKAKGKAKAPASKGKGKQKRAHDDDEEEEEDDEDDEPPAKKKKTKADDADDADDAPTKMVTVIKRGAAPVDEASGKVSTHQVYADGGEVWDSMLNQTDLVKNANKFYVIQLLHPVGNPSSCVLFTRWGRVGERGQLLEKGPFGPAAGVAAFKAQFKSKTGGNWEARHNALPKKGKYVWLERSFEEEQEEDKDKDEGSSKPKEEAKIPDSELPASLQAFCRLVFNTSFMDATLSEMNYDANKLPLGKLAKSTLLNGFAALKLLAEVISDPNGDAAKQYGGFRQACDELTGRYYSIIPHAFGRQRPSAIADSARLKKELELVDALGDMEIAQKLIQGSGLVDAAGRPVNPLDAQFRSLGLTAMAPVDAHSKEFRALEKYTRETHGATHGSYTAKVAHAFRVERATESEMWEKAGHEGLKDGERLLLWHGSRSTNFAGILKQGLRIAPPEAPVTGYMFGKGVYFADMMSKSANYCHAYLSGNVGILLLCEVAAKPFYEQNDSNYNADQDCKAAKKLVTKGVGRTQPVDWQDAGDALDNDLLKGCHMPAGPGKDVSPPGAYLQYNEYIAYDISQIRLRYLLMVNMK